MTTESRHPPAIARPAGRRIRVWAMVLAVAALGTILLEPASAGAHVLGDQRVPTGPSSAPGHDASARSSLGSGSPGWAAAGGGPQLGSYSWPVRGPVIRPFEPPANPYGTGHRGIDIAVPPGTRIRAPADGTVAFAGMIAGSLFISIDHPDGIRTSYSWISAIGVKKGQAVSRGDVIGHTGLGDPGSAQPCLHFGARLNGVYIDPMLLLGGGNLDDVIHLAPLG
jgi:murein DD-endopeptidase MepM/ murein hydrolase activator NlpD